MKRLINILFLVLTATQMPAQDVNDYLLKSSASLENGRYGDAISLCDRAILQFKDYRLYLVKAEAELKSGMLDQSVSSYKAASLIESAAGDFGLSLIYARRGDTELATRYLEQHLRSKFKKPEKDIVLNSNFESIQSSDKWKQLWRHSWYTELDKGISEALYLVENDRVDELEALAKHLSPVYYDDPAMIYLEGVVNMARGDIKTASSNFKRSIDMGYGAPAVWSNYIDALLKDENYAGAIDASGKALALNPTESYYLLVRAEANREAGDREKAFEDISYYLELFPNSEEGLLLAGKILNEGRSYSEALKIFTKCIDEYPGNPEHYIERGNVYSRTGTWQYAIYDYSMALDLRPGDGDVYYSKALALLRTGRVEDACRDFRMALKFGNKKAASEISKNCIK